MKNTTKTRACPKCKVTFHGSTEKCRACTDNYTGFQVEETSADSYYNKEKFNKSKEVVFR